MGLYENERDPRPWWKRWAMPTLVTFAVTLVLIVLVIGLATGMKSWGRYQKRADANNQVTLYNIQIRQQAQRVEIAKQQAQIRKENAVGIREAQDEIAATLTPLYVQFEMTEALKAIALSGHNNSVVYLPSGANGIPLVSTVDPTQVTAPDTKDGG